MLWFPYSDLLDSDLLDSQVYKKFETTEIYGFSFVSCTLSSR